jgi:hypothetical protein
MKSITLIVVCLIFTVPVYASDFEQIFRTDGAVVYYTALVPNTPSLLPKP